MLVASHQPRPRVLRQRQEPSRRQTGHHLDGPQTGAALLPHAPGRRPRPGLRHAIDHEVLSPGRDTARIARHQWTDAYTIRRYGADDPHARRAWQILLKTAYGYRADGNTEHGERDAAQDSIFDSQPSLTSTHAATWSPDVLRYNPAEFAPALTELLQVAPELRSTETYRYDLVDVARQVMANESRRMLPLIKQAYESKDKDAFDRLTKEWLRDMQLQNDLLQTNQFFLLGRWLSFVSRPGRPRPPELDRLNYDARSILTTWGDRHASEVGLHEYGNRDWAGLTKRLLHAPLADVLRLLSTSLVTGEPPRSIDWYAFRRPLES